MITRANGNYSYNDTFELAFFNSVGQFSYGLTFHQIQIFLSILRGNENVYLNDICCFSFQDYDYKSIMHYGSKFFNRNGADTIRPKEFYRINPNVIGRLYYSHGGEVLSELDVLKANIMYKCNKVKGEFCSES